MPTPSKLFMNWTGVAFTPSGGSAIAIDEVTDVSPDRKGQEKPWHADANPFPSAIAIVNQTRTVTLTSGNIAKLATVPINTPGTLVATLNDLRNGAVTGGGAITVTLSNAILTENPFSGKTQDYATGQLKFSAFSSDGTDPYAVAAV